MAQNLRTGWIGTGAMGIPMTENLWKAGFPLTVYNRTPEKAEPLVKKGIKTVAKPVLLWQNSDVVSLMISDDAASNDVVLGENGLLSGGRIDGKIIINHSTISPEESEMLAGKIKEKGGKYIDAPVAGSAWAAADGSLLMLIGGKQEELENLVPYFDALGKKNYFLGETGRGNKAKLAINYLIAINYLAIGETVLFASKMGIEKSLMMDIINNSGAGNVTSKAKTQPIVSDDFSTVAFSLDHMLKDVNLAAKEGNDYPLMKGLQSAYSEASAAGFGKKDVMEIIHFLAKKY